jgi:hypothetical protein
MSKALVDTLRAEMEYLDFLVLCWLPTSHNRETDKVTRRNPLPTTIAIVLNHCESPFESVGLSPTRRFP